MKEPVPCIDCLKLPICINRTINNSAKVCKELRDYIYEKAEVLDMSTYNMYAPNPIARKSVTLTRVNITHSRNVQDYYDTYKIAKINSDR